MCRWWFFHCPRRKKNLQLQLMPYPTSVSMVHLMMRSLSNFYDILWIFMIVSKFSWNFLKFFVVFHCSTIPESPKNVVFISTVSAQMIDFIGIFGLIMPRQYLYGVVDKWASLSLIFLTAIASSSKVPGPVPAAIISTKLSIFSPQSVGNLAGLSDSLKATGVDSSIRAAIIKKSGFYG